MPKGKPAKEKILAAACDVFMEKGYRGATVAEICGRAGANIAAVNYYFGGKEALYQEVWRHSLAESTALHPPDGGIAAQSPPETRLCGQITALMNRLADPQTKDFLISQMEIVNPTGLLEDVMREELAPLRKNTQAVVRELLGPEANEREVVYCEACIISMCVHPMLMLRAWQRTEKTRTPMIMDDLDAFVRHVARFALAGLNATRTQDK